MRFHRAAKFCRSQWQWGPARCGAARRWEGIGNDVLLMGGTSCLGSFLFAISNSRPVLTATHLIDLWGTQNSPVLAARPEKAADLKPATHCVLNKQRGKTKESSGGNSCILFQLCVFLCVVVQQTEIIYLRLWFSSSVTQIQGCKRSWPTLPPLLTSHMGECEGCTVIQVILTVSGRFNLSMPVWALLKKKKKGKKEESQGWVNRF